MVSDDCDMAHLLLTKLTKRKYFRGKYKFQGGGGGGEDKCHVYKVM